MNATHDFTSGYVRRVIDDELDQLFPHLPAVLIDGPKGVGKTATAQERSATIRRLDIAAERAVIEADPFVIRNDAKPVLIDEWHRHKPVWDAVRRLVDENRAGGQYLLTGSSPTIGTDTHSGAGRITTMRMRPLTLFERRPPETGISLAALLQGTATVGGKSSFTLSDYVEQIVASGFPGLQGVLPRARNRELDSYLERIVDRDFPEMDRPLRQPNLLMGWMKAYAAATASTTSLAKIRRAAFSASDGPSEPTASTYVEILKTIRILDPIPGWTPSHNHLGQLIQAEKHYLADPALAARLVRLSATDLLKGNEPDTLLPRDGTFLGALFESLAALSVRTFAQSADARVYHLRTSAGRQEVDFIVEGDAGAVLGLEVKLSGTIDDHDVRHLLWLRERLGEGVVDLVVIHTGAEAYRRQDGIAVIPLAMLSP